METDFVSWLISEMDKRGWSNSETAKQAGVVHSTISLVMNGRNKPGKNLCMKLAKAFNIPIEDVYRRAGLLPPRPTTVDEEQQRHLYEVYRRLPLRVRERVISYAEFEYEQLGKEQAPDE